jgi:hypothetical protein
MTTLADATLERLCDLFASGRMENAKEIARLLVQEVNERQPEPDALLASDLLRQAATAFGTPDSPPETPGFWRGRGSCRRSPP